MKKTSKVLILAALIFALSISPVFAVTGGFEDLDVLVEPINKFFTILKTISVCAMVGFSLFVAAKYLFASDSQKPEQMKGWFTALIVSAIMLLVAFLVPKLFGIGDVISDDGAIVLAQNFETALSLI